MLPSSQTVMPCTQWSRVNRVLEYGGTSIRVRTVQDERILRMNLAAKRPNQSNQIKSKQKDLLAKLCRSTTKQGLKMTQPASQQMDYRNDHAHLHNISA